MARYHILLIRQDGSTERIGEDHDDLVGACRTGFALADELSRDDPSGAAPSPRSIDVYRQSALIISIKVSPGRLADRSGDRRSVATSGG